MAVMPALYTADPVCLRHDLLIEIARIDMALDQVKGRQPAANQPDVVTSLEKRRATLSNALVRLTV